MPEEPEQVLVQERIAAARRIEEGGAEIAVGEQHGQRSREHRHRQQDQERGDQDRPNEQRHPKHRHSRRAHVEDRGDEVDRAKDRGGASKMQRQDCEIDRRARMSLGRQRRVERPPGSSASRAGLAGDEQRCQQ